jgi:hypothetical protein
LGALFGVDVLQFIEERLVDGVNVGHKEGLYLVGIILFAF